ncbi:MAG: AraC family transcriptional regulator [Chryseobacterium sp.]|uniref:helix-turn-helix transcriptional regulator n=1 Tax=Chryseobacterium sp. TaxID=1871047 RepID=UPI000DB090CD|nr:helix-turn-helix transcriptional regulator [Chryseobacterium sp.]MPS66791.1 AraC family transcriptional regulator [Chryseobacterium sp.]PZU10577.1 MAG: AraC family transcriptional regulator [Chryseobacterium sp.]
MQYKKIKPHRELKPFIHFYWELKGNEAEKQWERVFPDGCAGVLINLGNTCLTDNGSFSMEFGKTYVVGAMNSFKDSIIDKDTHLLGVCLKPATFANFYHYASQNELTNDTVEFEKSNSFNIDKTLDNPFNYFDLFFAERLKSKNIRLKSTLEDIHLANGKLSIDEVAKRNFTTVRQLERNFKKLIGLSPKEYSNIIRFQHALQLIKNSGQNRNLLDIAFECGYYDHSHLSNEIKRNTGLAPSLL